MEIEKTGPDIINRLFRTLPCLLILLTLFLNIRITAQDLFINEIMASNTATLADEDDEYKDWIEIYNSGPTPINLKDYGLSDHKSEPYLWTFPEIIIQPSEFMIIFASDKDRREYGLHYRTIINRGDEWKYIIPVEELPAEWNTVGFDDNGWGTGPSGFGYGDYDDSTIVPNNTRSVFMRKLFTLTDTTGIKAVILHMDYDDGFVAYLNGVEITRANIGVAGIPPAFDQFASNHEANIYNGGYPDRFDIYMGDTLLMQGDNVLAIQVHNTSETSSDLTGIPFLTLCSSNAFDGGDFVPEILNIKLPQLHTNFKIKSEGDTVVLTSSSGQTIDEKYTGLIPADISLGRKPDSYDDWYYFDEATPGESNTTYAYNVITGDEPVFSHIGGFYNNSFELSLSSVNPGDTIYYTLDGSKPDINSGMYLNPVSISSTSMLRARIIRKNKIPGPVVGFTYFFEREFDLPVISIFTDPANLWDNEYGIYVMGDNASPEFPHFGANFWMDWERPAHIELYETDGTQGFSVDAGIKIFGGWSRGFAQKSLSIFARSKYGDPSISYTIFPYKAISNFEAIVLRNSGKNWNNTMFRDGMMTSLVKNLNIDLQAYRPAVIYLNGEYWGIQNIREKVNEHFIASNHHVDADSIELLENNGSPIIGDGQHYANMINFITTNSLSDNSNYEYIKTQMDIDNYIQYQFSQIYFNNRDWPGNNIKYWRPLTGNGKWRWILFDTDFGFSIWDPYDYFLNTLAFALEPDNQSWPNPAWSTLLFRKLVENLEFRNNFITQFADHLNTTFRADAVVNHINNCVMKINTEIPHHYSRWEASLSQWSDKVSDMKTFANNRVSNVRNHILSEFSLPGIRSVTVDVSSENQGIIKVNTIYPDSPPWSGIYFTGVPVKLKAIPKEGYRFVEWKGDIESEQAEIYFDPTDDFSFTAHFESDDSLVSPVVINEINYKSHPSCDTEDWIELYNRSNQAVDISGWIFKDSDDSHSYLIPAGTIIQSDDYIVICRDVPAFLNYHPNTINYTGTLNFGFDSEGEYLRLYNDSSKIMDSVYYGIYDPWPPEPYSTPATLELKDPFLDNSLPESWTASVSAGTPGMLNGTEVDVPEIMTTAKDSKWINIYPNPFKTELNIFMNLNYREEAKIFIYNISGEVKNILTYKSEYEGIQSLTWDGTDKYGNKLPNGLYLIRIVTENKQASVKTLLLN